MGRAAAVKKVARWIRAAALLLAPMLCGCWYSLSISIVSGVGTDPITISSGSDPALDGDARDDGVGGYVLGDRRGAAAFAPH